MLRCQALAPLGEVPASTVTARADQVESRPRAALATYAAKVSNPLAFTPYPTCSGLSEAANTA